jgi:transposase-like protein
VLTDIGPVETEVPRDREGTFEPTTVRKRQRRLEGVDSMVISLSAKGLTHGEICAVKHILRVRKDFVSDLTMERYALTFNPGGFLRRLS